MGIQTIGGTTKFSLSSAAVKKKKHYITADHMISGNHYIATFDFNTSYTTLPSKDLIKVMFAETIRCSIKNSFVLFSN